jgi:formyl-CoA transferase
MNGPLHGIRVLDVTRILAGPFCTMLLADLGAEVIKIERPGEGDPARTLEPLTSDDSAYFISVNRGKKSITLNLATQEGQKIFKALVPHCDILVENFVPGTMAKFGLDYAAVRQINPRLIYASISGFGQDGPYADRPGFDQIAQGMGGLMSITGLPGHGPVRVGIPVADLTAGLFAAIGVLTALLERDKSGKGQAIETSLLQAQIFMLDFQAARYLVEGEVAEQAGNNHPTTIPTSAFKTRDGGLAGDVCVVSHERRGLRQPCQRPFEH